ncbi:hypothetical protein [Nocardiopsis sp. NPDC006832]|uniref:YobI family P-loop NTPase n=1 Tax=Nocardiopsis sp. NPDC006832 TaxID=3157188 RepID=UPI0033BFC160
MDVPLQSLAPKYRPEQHETYLKRLEEAVRDARNLNIALTGRYGAGKSSVLDQFEANHRKTTLRLAISTLAPGEEDTSTTNRIQKEIVKQLVYGASQKVGKNSRFSHINVLTKPVALLQSLLAVGIVGGLLYLLGWLPDIMWTGADEAIWVRTAAWSGTAALATLVVTAVRLATHGRFWVSNVTTGAGAVTLSEKPQTFFDKYIDEIVHYFEQEPKDIVVFEDLDRFEDPHIFEALRELNILLNDVPKRRRQRRGNLLGRIVCRVLDWLPWEASGFLIKNFPLEWSTRLLGLGRPLRFVYAVKDSLFERIDLDTAKTTIGLNGAQSVGGGEPRLDAAAAENQRANRTKFFDIVIPIVPFISHRSSRDLLLELLKQAGITGIDRQLVHIVSQHSTDMRLVRNMCNEYLIFAERLLDPKKTAPGLNKNLLFALVAYKNFHPSDFENIPRRASDLDLLYDFHQRLVRENIAFREQRKRDLQSAPDRERERDQLVLRLAARLRRYANTELRAHQSYQLQTVKFKVGSNSYALEQLDDRGFWVDLAQAKALTIRGLRYNSINGRDMAKWNQGEIQEVIPEALDSDKWAAIDASRTEADFKDIDPEIDLLRRAGFASLAAMDHFKLTMGSKDGNPVKKNFSDLVEETLKSDLARQLIRSGKIDRNFSLYASHFYGDFSGPDVANFMVHHVQPKTMNIDYDLKRKDAVGNLLEEAENAGEDFTRTIAAYNIDVVNHLLATGHPGADHVVQNLITHFDENARAFLASYFTNDTAEREKLAARLTEHRWRQVFTYLVSDEGVPAKARASLVSAALCAFDPQATYDLSVEVIQFITDHYHHMSAFTDLRPHPDPQLGLKSVAERVDTVLERTSIVLPEIDKLEPQLLSLVVAANGYQLNAANLRTALGIVGSISLDHVQRNEMVYEYCLARSRAYREAVDADEETEHTMESQQILIKVLNDIADIAAKWGDEDSPDHDADALARLLGGASADALLNSVHDVPPPTWSAVAAAGLLHTSLTNVEAYRAEIGSIDASLARALETSGTIHVSDPEDFLDESGQEHDRETAAIAILNATTFSSPEARVSLVESFYPSTHFAVTEISPEKNNLFALLLQNNRIADDEASFMHFRNGGWDAIGPAIKASKKIGDFISPMLVGDMVTRLLKDPACASKVGRIIVENIETYLPDDDDMAGLKAAAEHADAWHIPLAPDTVVRIAHAGTVVGTPLDGPERTLRLLCAARPDATSDQIVEVLSHLGDPYDQIRQTGAKFQLPHDSLHEQLLPILKADGLISWSTTRKSPRKYIVTVR